MADSTLDRFSYLRPADNNTTLSSQTKSRYSEENGGDDSVFVREEIQLFGDEAIDQVFGAATIAGLQEIQQRIASVASSRSALVDRQQVERLRLNTDEYTRLLKGDNQPVSLSTQQYRQHYSIGGGNSANTPGNFKTRTTIIGNISDSLTYGGLNRHSSIEQARANGSAESAGATRDRESIINHRTFDPSHPSKSVNSGPHLLADTISASKSGPSAAGNSNSNSNFAPNHQTQNGRSPYKPLVPRLDNIMDNSRKYPGYNQSFNTTSTNHQGREGAGSMRPMSVASSHGSSTSSIFRLSQRQKEKLDDYGRRLRAELEAIELKRQEQEMASKHDDQRRDDDQNQPPNQKERHHHRSKHGNKERKDKKKSSKSRDHVDLPRTTDLPTTTTDVNTYQVHSTPHKGARSRSKSLQDDHRSTTHYQTVDLHQTGNNPAETGNNPVETGNNPVDHGFANTTADLQNRLAALRERVLQAAHSNMAPNSNSNTVPAPKSSSRERKSNSKSPTKRIEFRDGASMKTGGGEMKRSMGVSQKLNTVANNGNHHHSVLHHHNRKPPLHQLDSHHPPTAVVKHHIPPRQRSFSTSHARSNLTGHNTTTNISALLRRGNMEKLPFISAPGTGKSHSIKVNLQQLLATLKSENQVLHQVCLKMGTKTSADGATNDDLAAAFRAELLEQLSKHEAQLEKDFRMYDALQEHINSVDGVDKRMAVLRDIDDLVTKIEITDTKIQRLQSQISKLLTGQNPMDQQQQPGSSLTGPHLSTCKQQRAHLLDTLKRVELERHHAAVLPHKLDDHTISSLQRHRLLQDNVQTTNVESSCLRGSMVKSASLPTSPRINGQASLRQVQALRQLLTE